MMQVFASALYLLCWHSLVSTAAVEISVQCLFKLCDVLNDTLTCTAAGLLDDMLDIHGEQPAGSAELCATFA